MLKATVIAAAVATMLTGSAFATSYGGSYDAYIYQPDFRITAHYDAYYEYAHWGEYCYTDMGLVGPGPSMPVGADCTVWTPYGEVYGTVSQSSGDWGTWCRTSYGDAGPSPVMLVGSWCVVRTSYGEVHGYIIPAYDH